MLESRNELAIIRTAKQSTRLTLVAGTILFITVMLTKAKTLMFASLIFTVFAGLANGLLFIMLLLHLLGPRSQKKILQTAILMLINIPVAVLYIWLITERTRPNF